MPATQSVVSEPILAHLDLARRILFTIGLMILLWGRLLRTIKMNITVVDNVTRLAASIQTYEKIIKRILG